MDYKYRFMNPIVRHMTNELSILLCHFVFILCLRNGKQMKYWMVNVLAILIGQLNCELKLCSKVIPVVSIENL